MKLRLLHTWCFLFVAVLSFAQEEVSNEMNLFNNANKAYTNENYDVAIAAYEQILKTDKHSVEVYYNLANSYYKKNQVAPAIYNYERALQLDPENTDVLNNLRFANQMKIDAIESLPKGAVASTVEDIAYAMSVDNWAYLSLVLLLLSIFCIILFVYAGTPGKRRLFFILSFLAVIFTILSVCIAFYAKDYLGKEQYAIVFAEEFMARAEPKLNSEVGFTVHEGTKVEILEQFEGWYKVALANGSTAWITEESVKLL